MADLSDVLTGVIITSPVVSHPSTELLDRVILSFNRHLSGFQGCRLVIVCDGYLVGEHDPSKRNFGTVTPQQAADYEAFKTRLVARARHRPGMKVVQLSDWRGFALGLQVALEEFVETPLVLVSPHDYELVHELDSTGICGLILRSERLQGKLPPITEVVRGSFGTQNGFVASADDDSAKAGVTAGYVASNQPVTAVHLVSNNAAAAECQQPLLVSYVGFCAANQLRKSLARGRAQVSPTGEAEAIEAGGVRLLPLPAWKENPHIASVAAYRRLVYGHDRFRAGEFIEDRLGNVMRNDIRIKGPDHHRMQYGTYSLLPQASTGKPVPALYHMDGRCYKPVADRLAMGWKVADWEVERATAAAAMVESTAEVSDQAVVPEPSSAFAAKVPA